MNKKLNFIGKSWGNIFSLGLVATMLTFASSQAHACGGFFCGQQPVDQSAERILFSVNDDDTTTMIVQISYEGTAENFAWVIPIASVPTRESLDTFPQLSLSALDAQSTPTFNPPDDCNFFRSLASAADAGTQEDANSGGVTVHIRQEVGPYDVAVVESESATALTEWLRTNGYRVTGAMEPYIQIYTRERMKFLALKLLNGRDTRDIAPFKMTLEGSTPSVPLRLTALAALPEMGISVFVLGDRRFEPKNEPNVEITDGNIVWHPRNFGQNNYLSLVAQEIDAAGGKGWITEFAGGTGEFIERVRNGFNSTPEQEEAANKLLELLEARPYLTRLYTRRSPEEMLTDVVFGRTDAGDVSRQHTLPRYVNGEDVCRQVVDFNTNPASEAAISDCDFTTCGAGGHCAEAEEVFRDERGNVVFTDQVPACACAPGAAARVVRSSRGGFETICQDLRLSFMNPGDRLYPEDQVLPDPCATFSCGDNGRCININMSPSCECDQGFVAKAVVNTDPNTGTVVSTGIQCVEPIHQIPAAFYNTRLPALPSELPGGRTIEVAPPSKISIGTGCSVASVKGETHALWITGLLLGVLAVFRKRG